MPAALLLVLATLMTPAYLLLDSARLVPVALRDRPWPFALVAVLLPLYALRLSPRLRALAIAIAFVSAGALGWAAWARYRLPPSSPGAELGAPLPDVTLDDQAGRPVRLRALAGRPLMVVWFRGSWCPYCRRQLADLASQAAHFSADDFRIVAVAPDPPEPLARLERELKLPFTLLSDPDRKLVNRCELAHCVAILDADGIVRWQVVSGNWERDLPARALTQAAYRRK